jgi:hypothetical protein
MRAADINKDGLPDLFIGGRFMPGFFLKAPESYIFFEKDAVQTDTVSTHPGMVTDRCLLLMALWLFLQGYLYDRNIIICPYRSKLLMKAKM